MTPILVRGEIKSEVPVKPVCQKVPSGHEPKSGKKPGLAQCPQDTSVGAREGISLPGSWLLEFLLGYRNFVVPTKRPDPQPALPTI